MAIRGQGLACLVARQAFGLATQLRAQLAEGGGRRREQRRRRLLERDLVTCHKRQVEA